MTKRKRNPFSHRAEASEMRRRLAWRQHWCWSSELTYLLIFLCGYSCPPISETCFICQSNPPCYQDCDWVWSVCICTKDRLRREAGPGGFRGRGALHQDPGWNRQKQARPRGRWFGDTEWTPLISPDEPKSWLESGGNLGKACTTGLPHVGPAAARNTRSSCSAHPILLLGTCRATKTTWTPGGPHMHQDPGTLIWKANLLKMAIKLSLLIGKKGLITIES